jgi:hypothetical protein
MDSVSPGPKRPAREHCRTSRGVGARPGYVRAHGIPTGGRISRQNHVRYKPSATGAELYQAQTFVVPWDPEAEPGAHIATPNFREHPFHDVGE